MVDTAQIIFTDHDGNTVNFFTSNAKIKYLFDGLKVYREQASSKGKAIDSLRQYREVSCSAIMSGDTLNTLNGYLMDTAKVYDGTDPKIVIYLDGDTSLTILCAVVSVTATHMTQGRWSVEATFVERAA